MGQQTGRLPGGDAEDYLSLVTEGRLLPQALEDKGAPDTHAISSAPSTVLCLAQHGAGNLNLSVPQRRPALLN